MGIYRHGLHLCVNCEEEDAGLRPAEIKVGASRESDQSPPKCRLVARDRVVHPVASPGNFIAGVMGEWNAKGFGFITPSDGGKDIFCHVSNLEDGEGSVREGDAC